MNRSEKKFFISNLKSNYTTPETENKIMGNVKKVSSSWDHSLIITNENELFIYAESDDYLVRYTGILNINIKPQFFMENVKDVCAGDYTSFIIKDDNSLWVFGLNSYIEYQ